jgi:hypothetical protein
MSGTDIFTNKDLIMYKEGGKIMSGGYAVNSILMNSGMAPLNSYHYGGSKSLERSIEGSIERSIERSKERSIERSKEEESKYVSFFDNLAVPVGIFYINSDYIKSDYEKPNTNTYEERYMLSDDIYDKLFELASFKQSKNTKNRKNTRKNTSQILNNQHKKTKRAKM